MKVIILLLKREGYVVLISLLGILGIAEGLRVDATVRSANFLSGPGGYLTIIGISLLLFGIIDIIRQLIMRQREHLSQRSQMDHDEATRIATFDWKGLLTLDRSRMTPNVKMRLSFILCIFYVLIIQPLGFTIATIIYLVANFWLLSNKTKTILFTVVVMFIILRFGLPAMGLSVPKGLFGI